MSERQRDPTNNEFVLLLLCVWSLCVCADVCVAVDLVRSSSCASVLCVVSVCVGAERELVQHSHHSMTLPHPSHRPTERNLPKFTVFAFQTPGQQNIPLLNGNFVTSLLSEQFLYLPRVQILFEKVMHSPKKDTKLALHDQSKDRKKKMDP